MYFAISFHMTLNWSAFSSLLNVQALKSSCHAVMLGVHATFVHNVVNSVPGVHFDNNYSFQTPFPTLRPHKKAITADTSPWTLKKERQHSPIFKKQCQCFKRVLVFLIREEFSVKWDLTQSEAYARTEIDTKTLFISMKRPWIFDNETTESMLWLCFHADLADCYFSTLEFNRPKR